MQTKPGADQMSLLGPPILLAVALGALGIRLLRAGHRVRAATASPLGPLLPGAVASPAVAIGAAALGLVLIAAGLVWAGRFRRQLGSGVLGRARTAGARDLASLRRRRHWPGRGPQAPTVRLGSFRRRAVHLPAEEHLLVLGPTGAGKSSSLAIPAILEWPGPVVVTDPKGELVQATAAGRSRLGKVAIFAPLMEPASRWNPVASIQSSEDALRAAGFLMGRSPEREPFWHDLARQLLHGLLVEAAYAGFPIAAVLSLLQVAAAEELSEMMVHPIARQLVQGALSGGDRTAMGVVATLVSQLGAYGSETVARATSASDFDPGGLASGELMTLYCVVSPHDAPLLRGLISALLSACWRGIYTRPPSPPALFVLDEFAQLTNLTELPSLVQLGRSQGARMILMAQDLASISATYGAEASAAIWANCRTKLILPGVSEIELLERISKLAGTATLHRSLGDFQREAVSSQPLLHPDDVRRLRAKQALVLRGADHPALISQRRWFEDRHLRRLVSLGSLAESLPLPAAGTPLRDRQLLAVPAGSSPRPLDWDPADGAG